MTQIINFLHMGGYATYVWSAYGVTALVLVGYLIIATRRFRRVLKQIEHETDAAT